MIHYLFMSNEQTHPLHATDKNIIDSLITKEKPEDLDFINLARLINRYSNFPGEIEIKNDIEKILKFWKITKNQLHKCTIFYTLCICLGISIIYKHVFRHFIFKCYFYGPYIH